MKISGVRIDAVDMSLAVGCAMQMDGGCIFTPNAVMLDTARRNTELYRALNQSALNLPDGVGTVIAARLLYGKKIKRVTGVDFGIELAGACAEKNKSIFLFGGEKGVAEAAAKSLCEKIPDLKIVGIADGYSEIDAACEIINESGADFAFVCLGSPRQELWAAKNSGALSHCTLIGLGGSLDVYAGKVHRAPRFLSVIGLEWAWRILLQPRRLKNIPSLFRFFLSVFGQRRLKKDKKHRKNRKIKQN